MAFSFVIARQNKRHVQKSLIEIVVKVWLMNRLGYKVALIDVKGGGRGKIS